MHKSTTIVSLSLTTILAIILTGGCGRHDSLPKRSFQLTGASGGVSSAAIAPDGTVYWTWFDQEAGETNVYLSSLSPDATEPSSSVRVNRLDGDANMHGQAPAQVAIGPAGEVYVAWTNRIDVEGRRFPASDLLFARSIDRGRTFSKALIVNDDAGGVPTGHTFHDIAVGPNGEIYVSWIDTRNLDAVRGLELDDEAPLDHASGDHMHGHDHAGEENLPGPEIRIAKSADGGRSFTRSVVVDASSCPCCRTSLAIGSDGVVYVAWRKVYPGDIRDMAVARSDDGGMTFSEPKRIHEDKWQFSGCPHTGPDLAVDPAGHLHAAWYTGAKDASGLYYAVERREGFSDPVLLVADAPVSQVRLASDPSGGIWIAWEDKRAGNVKLAHADDGIVAGTQTAVEGEEPALAAGSGVASISVRNASGVSAQLLSL